MNKNMNYKDMGLIKGALRRSFARSDLYKEAYNRYKVDHYDPLRPKCLNWVFCNICGIVIPKWKTTLDHIDPMVPIDSHFEFMPIAESINRLWCSIENLQALCDLCHTKKSAKESEQRKPYKKPRNKRK